MFAIEELGIESLNNSQYSADLSPHDFWLFPNLKYNLRWTRSEDREEFLQAISVSLRTLANDGMQHIYMDLWDKCIRCKGGYFQKGIKTFMIR